jgi:hypothetical protein
MTVDFAAKRSVTHPCSPLGNQDYYYQGGFEERIRACHSRARAGVHATSTAAPTALRSTAAFNDEAVLCALTATRLQEQEAGAWREDDSTEARSGNAFAVDVVSLHPAAGAVSAAASTHQLEARGIQKNHTVCALFAPLHTTTHGRCSTVRNPVDVLTAGTFSRRLPAVALMISSDQLDLARCCRAAQRTGSDMRLTGCIRRT